MGCEPSIEVVNRRGLKRQPRSVQCRVIAAFLSFGGHAVLHLLKCSELPVNENGNGLQLESPQKVEFGCELNSNCTHGVNGFLRPAPKSR